MEPHVGYGEASLRSRSRRFISCANAACVSRDLNAHEDVLSKWAKKFGSDPKQAFTGHGRHRPRQLEIERPRRETTKVRTSFIASARAYGARRD